MDTGAIGRSTSKARSGSRSIADAFEMRTATGVQMNSQNTSKSAILCPLDFVFSYLSSRPPEIDVVFQNSVFPTC